MVNVTRPYCIEDGCETYPTFNYKGKNKGLYCVEHKKENMVDVIHRKCAEEGCDILPVFNYKGEKKGLYCVEHKKKI